MKNIKRFIGFGAVILGFSSFAFAMGHEVASTDNFNMNIGGRIQEVAYGELVDDPYADDARVYLFLKQARFRVNGHVNGVKYDMQWVGAAEDVANSNVGLTLLDASFDVPLFNLQSTFLKVGQFKVPYSRESVNEEAEFQMVEHSINFLGFNLGRDYGAALHTYQGKFAGTLGVFSGGARDVPLRFLPERLGIPMTVVRFGYNDGLDKDLYTVSQNDLKPVRTTKATFINAMYMKDTRIGHSTVLNSRTTEKSILMNTNWNPFLNQTDPGASPNKMNSGDFWQLGWDAAARGPVGGLAWSSEIELNYAQYKNKYGAAHLNGGRIQGAIAGKNLEFALRYSLMTLDDNLVARNTTASQTNNAGTKISNGKPIQEVVPALTYYISGHDHKVVLDAPILINVPVFIENNLNNQNGALVGTEQVDQVTLTAGGRGTLDYQTVPELRLMYQLAF